MNIHSASHTDTAHALEPNTFTALNVQDRGRVLAAQEEEQLQYCLVAPNVVDDDNDAHSLSSTVCNAHESFETFQHKVTELIALVFDVPVLKVQTEHISGGSFNRVVGANIHPTEPKEYTLEWIKSYVLRVLGKASPEEMRSYVVRIPRQQNSALYENVAVLESLRTRLPIPIPEVMSYDTTSDNVLEKPYMILQRLPGQSLAHMWNSGLNLEQNKSVVRRLAALVPEIASLKATLRGASLDTSTGLGKMATQQICRLIYGRGRLQTPLENLLHACEYWRERYKEIEDGVYEKIMDRFVDISNALHTRGFLNGPCVLVHGDLMAYNLLAEVQSETHVEITGVIDWDTATMAPEFMAYRAPFWLWTPAETPTALVNHEDIANIRPTTEVEMELKEVFESCASRKYKMFAFAHEAVLARRMYAILFKGLQSMEDVEEAENIVQCWQWLHPEDIAGYD